MSKDRSHLNKIDEIRSLQRRRLFVPYEMVDGKNVVVWGAGVSGKNFIRTNNQIKIDLVIDTRIEKQSSSILGHAVNPISDLQKFDPDNTCVILANEIHESCKNYLSENGYYLWFVPERFLASQIAIYFDGINKKDFVRWANNEKINYALDRFTGDYSNTGDLDMLVDTNDLERIMQHDCARAEPSSPDSWVLDIACASPVGLENELMLYPPWVARQFLQHREFSIDFNAYVLTAEHQLWSIFYHIFVHLGTFTALRKYVPALEQLDPSLLNQFDAKSVFDIFFASSMFPGIDFLRKWVDYNDGDLIKSCLPKKSSQSTIVYILRDGLEKISYGTTTVLNDLMNVHDIIVHETFEKYQVSFIKERIRGGIWSDNVESELGGDPLGYVYVRNNLPFNEVQRVKDAIRKKISNKFGQEINILHSSDDDIEAEYFLRIIAESKKE